MNAAAAIAAHPLPLAALDGKVGILGITGSGKTYTAIGLVEILLALGRQTIIIDPTGAYHGLRTVFPIPIFGGPQGDVPITDSDGAAVARAIVDMGISAILDVSLLLKESHASSRRFMAGFVASLKNNPPAARYVVIDEADEFMPENASGAAAGLMGDLKWMVRRGRKDGWRVMMVTQRPQDIAKSVLTQCETLIVHKLTSPQDRKAFQEWVKGNADTAEAKAVLDSLAKLTTGEAWIWSPSYGILERVTLPANQSADSSKTPEAGEALDPAANFQPVNIAAVLERLGAPVDESTQSDPKVAQAEAAEISRLRAQVAELQRAGENLGHLRAGFAFRGELLEQILGSLELRIPQWQNLLTGLQADVENARRKLESAPATGAGETAPVEAPESAHPDAPAPSRHRAPASLDSGGPRAVLPTIEHEALALPSGKPLLVLQTLADFVHQHPSAREKGVKEATWAFLCGISRKSSTWRSHKAAIKGYFVRNGDRFTLTAAGEAFCPPPAENDQAAVKTGADLVRELIPMVKLAGAAKMVEELLRAWPNSLTRAHLAQAADTSLSSSTFRSYLARLNRLELIEKDGQDFRLSRDLMEW